MAIRTSLVLLLLLTLSPDGWGRKAPKSLVDSAVEAVNRKLDETLVPPPADLEVCFTPGEPCDVKVWKFIQSASKTLDVAGYDFTHDKIVHEILVASKKIPVRILTDRKQGNGKHSLVPLMIKAGAQVRYGRQRGVMHHKFIIVDGSRIETGSFNFTNGAIKKNQENQIYLANTDIVARYRERFDAMWEDAAPARLSVSKSR